MEDVVTFAKIVWARGGEGAILKRRRAAYQAGKRSADFVKVKKTQSATLEVVGFVAGKNGDFSTVELKDADGNTTTVKTKNNAELARFAREWAGADPLGRHPALGRSLRIDYSDRTRDGGYENPRWDRWERE
jgi:ATP-dependent DNA ligase